MELRIYWTSVRKVIERENMTVGRESFGIRSPKAFKVRRDRTADTLDIPTFIRKGVTLTV